MKSFLKRKKWILLTLLGVVVFVADLASYNFKYNYQELTTLGILVYGISIILILLGVVGSLMEK